MQSGIFDYLRAHVAELALALLGEPATSSEREWRYGKKGSLSVVISGDNVGAWKDHETDDGGGPIELIQRHAQGVSDQREALDWARRWAGGAVADYQPHPRPTTVRAESGGQIDRARRLWSEAVAAAGTDAERYLRGRGITAGIDRVRYHPSVPVKADRPRAAVLFQTAGGAVQVVYLAHDAPRRADLPKQTFGRWCGPVIHQDGEGPTIVCEGPETALSAATACPT